MANLQVKDFPERLHGVLRDRAKAERTTMSALIIDILQKHLEYLELEVWLDEVRELPLHEELDVQTALDEARDEIEGR